MNYQGMMDGWNGDEKECNGTCGLCEECIEHHEMRCNEEYDQWRNG